MSSLVIADQDGVRRISLNRPQVKNAMNEAMIAELHEAFSKIPADIRLVVFNGEGDFFCAGGDLNWMKDSIHKSATENEADAKKLGQMLRAIDECEVPVLTFVQGGAFGGGVGLVACSDIVVADTSAVFSLSEVKLGLIPATIGPLVLRKIGVSAARRLYLSGMRFSADQANSINLVHEVVSKEKFEERLSFYLKEFSSSGPEAVKIAKSLIRDLSSGKLWQKDIAEETSQLLAKVRVDDEAQEGISAFFEKRKASWRRDLKIS